MKNKNEITIVSQMFYPDTISTARVMTDLSEGISDEYKVRVICQNRSYIEPEKLFHESCLPKSSIEIIRFGVPALDKNKMLSRLLLSLATSVGVKRKLRETNSEIYLAVSNPPNIPLIVGKYAKKVSSKFVFLLHDLYPDIFYKLGYMKKNSFIYKHLKQITKKAFDIADVVIVLGKDVKKYIVKEYGVNKEKIEIITNWIPRKLESINTLKSETNREKDYFKLVYAGNIGETAELELLIRAFKEVEDLPLELIVVGTGKYKKYHELLARKLEMNNVVFTGYLQDNEFEDVLSKANGFFVSLKKDLCGISVPSKIYHYLKYKKPILGLLPKESESTLLIQKSGLGIICNDYNVNSLAESLKKIISFKNLRIDEDINKQYTWENVMTDFKKLLANVKEG